MLDRQIWLTLVAAAIASALASACGGGVEGSPCAQDQDCASGTVCIDAVCKKPGAAPRDGGGARDGATAAGDRGPETGDRGEADVALDGAPPDSGIADDAGFDSSDRSDLPDGSEMSDVSETSDGGVDASYDAQIDTGTTPDNGNGTDAESPDSGETDAGQPEDAGTGDAGLTADKCWEHKSCPTCPGPDYDQFNPIIGSHCLGTNHQDIAGIEKVVFLGDSVTVGTPPTYSKGYRFTLGKMLSDKFGQIENKSCAEWGARTDDLLKPSNQQIINCFPNLPEQKKTLVVMTVGGNDMFAWQKKNAEGATVEEIMVMVEAAITDLRDAIAWLLDPAKFPNGIYIMFGNNYEYSDGTGDLLSCPTAKLAGVTENWPEGAGPVIYFNEQYMKAAVDYNIDLIFMLENFCGHGFHYDDPTTQCYEPGAELWFDITCIHPNPTGHEVIANMFMAVVNE